MSLATDALEVRYADRVVVRPLSIALGAGELIGLIGPNGAGKTSLLRSLAGIPVPGRRVSWLGRSLDTIPSGERSRTIAYLAQSPRANWPLSVRELVELGRLPHRRFGQRWTTADHGTVARVMEWTDTSALAARRIDTLSGGERMRVHLARAFAVDAPVLLVDEPTASLDPFHQLGVMRLLGEYRDAGRLVVAVLHDLNLALAHCSRLLLMDNGAIVADGEPRDVIDAGTLARHYRIRAYLAEHENRRIAVPWETLKSHE